MTTLRQRIKELLCTSEVREDGESRTKQFVPLESLYRLLSRDQVEQVVNNTSEIEWFQRDDTVNWIMEYARRIFAILIMLEDKEMYIVNFIQKDISDGNLPITFELLSDIVPGISSGFYEQQWEFAAPKLAKGVIHRVLHPDHRLPFIHNEKLEEGGFGGIYKVVIHPDHQSVSLLPEEKEQGIVRKEFKVPPGIRKRDKRSDKENHRLELRNLSIMNELNHPNIIQMLTSYTHNGKHNFIFPHIQDGSLEALFKNTRPSPFRLDETFLTALCGLSSAIEGVHFYTLKRLNIEMIGCHHDLKPKNILVQGAAFVLADFGLSKLKEVSDSSRTLYGGGGGDYLAPECEDCDDGFEKHSVSRSSDIWSFGCIIAEILTFMLHGADGIQQFRSERKVLIADARMASFHAGIRRRNQKALDWISSLQDESKQFCRPIVQLINSMLDMHPDARPDARSVTAKLRYITVQAHASNVQKLYNDLSSKLPDSFDAYSEEAKFTSWKTVVDNATVDEDSWGRKLDARMDLMSTVRSLENLREELISIISRCEGALSPLFTTLRHLSNELLGFLPDEMQSEAKAKWEIEMVNTEELDELEGIQSTFEDSFANSRIGMLARIKRMTIIAAQQGEADDSDLQVDPKRYKIIGACGNHNFAIQTSENKHSERRVLIEWIKYGNHETGNFERLFSRIKALVDVLHSVPDLEDLRNLRCSAFTHDRSECAFGLVYDFPSQLSSKKTEPKTLATIISETSEFRERPTLESRILLARTLAQSLFSFHNVGWLHKSISPYNVLFFVTKRSKAAGWLKQPYLTGFNHSRQDDPLAFTAGPSADDVESKYYHPDYIQMHGSEVKYSLKFDYYSLGLVLLEIGLWKTLKDILNDKSYDPNQDLLSNIRKKRVPLLGHYMGTGYQNAVLACLDHLQKVGVTDSTNSKVLKSEFGKQVIEPLRRCSA